MYTTYDLALSLMLCGSIEFDYPFTVLHEIPICYMQSKTNGSILDDND